MTTEQLNMVVSILEEAANTKRKVMAHWVEEYELFPSPHAAALIKEALADAQALEEACGKLHEVYRA